MKLLIIPVGLHASSCMVANEKSTTPSGVAFIMWLQVFYRHSMPPASNRSRLFSDVKVYQSRRDCMLLAAW